MNIDKIIKELEDHHKDAGYNLLFGDGYNKAIFHLKVMINEESKVKENELLHDISYILPPLNTVKQEIVKYKETTMQGDKGHFQNGINWAFNYVANKIKK